MIMKILIKNAMKALTTTNAGGRGTANVNIKRIMTRKNAAYHDKFLTIVLLK